MPWYVNGQHVPEALIHEAEQWLARDPRWQSIPDESERARQLHTAAEQAAIERVLLEQIGARDRRPIDPKLIDQEIQRQAGSASGRPTVFDDARVRALVERELRRQRVVREMVTGAAQPSAEEVEAFYNEHKQNFRTQTMFRAAHIVREVNGLQSEEEAEAGIRAALTELDIGAPFAR